MTFGTLSQFFGADAETLRDRIQARLGPGEAIEEEFSDSGVLAAVTTQRVLIATTSRGWPWNSPEVRSINFDSIESVMTRTERSGPNWSVLSVGLLMGLLGGSLIGIQWGFSQLPPAIGRFVMVPSIVGLLGWALAVVGLAALVPAFLEVGSTRTLEIRSVSGEDYVLRLGKAADPVGELIDRRQ